MIPDEYFIIGHFLRYCSNIPHLLRTKIRSLTNISLYNSLHLIDNLIMATSGKPKIVAPAGYEDGDSDSDFYYDDRLTRNSEPPVRVFSPPDKLSTSLIEKERSRFTRETNAFLSDENNTSNMNNSVIKSAADPVGIARQVRHLHNRVKLLEEELQTMNNRQIFMMGLATVVAVTGCIKVLYK